MGGCEARYTLKESILPSPEQNLVWHNFCNLFEFLRRCQQLAPLINSAERVGLIPPPTSLPPRDGYLLHGKSSPSEAAG
ncbi:hypothetical protein MTP99_011690 [Tenebrio molitor]|nr:hypothetical protein MTP99_011690 [Tenebrio molitor]